MGGNYILFLLSCSFLCTLIMLAQPENLLLDEKGYAKLVSCLMCYNYYMIIYVQCLLRLTLALLSALVLVERRGLSVVLQTMLSI